MRSQSALLLLIAVLPVMPAMADEMADESRAIQAIGRFGAKVELDSRLPGRPVVGLRFYKNFADKDCRLLKSFHRLKSLDLRELKITDAGLHEIRELRNLSELDFRHNQITAASMTDLRGLTDLTKLDLTGDAITDVGLAQLRDLKHLTTLGLAYTKITDAGLKQLRNMTRLSTLDLSGNEITDAGLSELRNLKELTELDLRHTHVAGNGLKELRNLKQLTKLNLPTERITDTGLKEVGELKNLTEMDLAYTQVTDAGLKELVGLARLSTLNLSDTKVTSAGLTELKRLTNLREIDIEPTAANLRGLAALPSLREVDPYYHVTTDSALKDLAALKNLTSLNLSQTVTDAGLAVVPQFEKLTKLDLSNTKITDAAFKSLGRSTTLVELDLSSTPINGAGFKELHGLRNLKQLNLHGTKITDASLKDLAGITSLTEVDLSSTHITGAGLRELGRLGSLAELKLTQVSLTDDDAKELRGLKHLQQLDVSTNNLTDAGAAELAHIDTLTSLNLGVNLVSDAGLKELGRLQNLTALDLTATAMTDDGLKELRRLPNLAELNLDYTDITGSGLKDLGGVTKLSKLRLDGTKLTDAGLLSLRELKHLAELVLPNPADVYDRKYDLIVQSGWRVSPDFKRMIVPLWICPDKYSPSALAPSYTALALLDLDRPLNARILPYTGLDSSALPAYLDNFTAWSANSAALAYFGEFDSGDRSYGFANTFNWRPVWLDLKTGKTAVLKTTDFGPGPLHGTAALRISPSGRYVVIPTLVNRQDRSAGQRFLLWEPAAGTVRELLRAEHASGMEPYQATLAWSSDEKTVYLAVGTSDGTKDGKEVETWRLCECRLDGQLPYTSQTARALFTLSNEKGYREAHLRHPLPFEIDRNLQILELRPHGNSLIFYRGDSVSYWTMNLATGHLQERFPSPFAKRENGSVSYKQEFADSWAWQNAELLAIVRHRDKEGTILVGDPARGHAFREIVRGPSGFSSVHWMTPEWLAYTMRRDAGCQSPVPKQIWAVNVQSAEKRQLVSEELERHIRRQFLDDVARRKGTSRKSRASATNN
jgi:Leucine-rich repeat (LRR) protein